MNANDFQQRFDLIARQYDEGRKCFIPCFDYYYNRSVSMLKNLKPGVSSTVDLRADNGADVCERYKRS